MYFHCNYHSFLSVVVKENTIFFHYYYCLCTASSSSFSRGNRRSSLRARFPEQRGEREWNGSDQTVTRREWNRLLPRWSSSNHYHHIPSASTASSRPHSCGSLVPLVKGTLGPQFPLYIRPYRSQWAEDRRKVTWAGRPSKHQLTPSKDPFISPASGLGSKEGYHMPTVGLCARSLHSLPHPNRFNLNDNSQGRKDRSHRLSATLSARLRRGVWDYNVSEVAVAGNPGNRSKIINDKFSSSWSYKSESFSVSILSLWSHLIVLTSWIERSMWWTIIPCHWALGTSSDSSSHPQFIESFFLAYIIIRGHYFYSPLLPLVNGEC